ncbi:DNA gyrase inhibitor YacG [Zavarzinia compransoris]|uniref:DNA gyrase inhibitor YacG n=1 Tax=Zavarzinia marina TaxID=2911065 RepID=UPI001F2A301D|nr:DNA gyrase inhibitor YacG [Zavarzinia marina]MCF4165573.1 DNA gyrase inhibitor YacG [Zavarzinia marina]
MTKPAPANDNPRPCPICGRPSMERHRPFCSPRCADVDLSRWLGGHYAIPAAESEIPGDDGFAPGDSEDGR